MALGGLLISLPVLLLAGLGVLLTSGFPVLFRHRRVGRTGATFALLKLRTMRSAPGGAQLTARDDPRITRVGSILRRTKIDELPGLWNVIRGEMALVGPRPEVPDYVDLRDPVWRAVLQARPGLTDPITLSLRGEEELLAAVEGDRDRFYREVLRPFKVRESMRYLQQRSWRSDLAVLCRTAGAGFGIGGATKLTLSDILAHGGGSGGSPVEGKTREEAAINGRDGPGDIASSGARRRVD